MQEGFEGVWPITSMEGNSRIAPLRAAGVLTDFSQGLQSLQALVRLLFLWLYMKQRC
jgi:hypothetical protein